MVEEGHILIDGVSKSFDDANTAGGRQVILSGITLDIEPGSFTSFIGPSGCGKSTLLRIISGFLFPDSGKVVGTERKWKGRGWTGASCSRTTCFSPGCPSMTTLPLA